jgi:L-fucose isomerase-like protein
MIGKHTKVLLGFVPIGKFCFSHEDALKQKQSIEQVLIELHVPYIGVDTLIPDGMVRSDEDAQKVIRYFETLPPGQKPDALFLPHCNFGTETAVGILARAMGIPVLLWGPQDETPQQDGTRLRDSLCGVLASSKVLQNCDVPFTYIPNCFVHDVVFRLRLTQFIRTVAVVRRFKKGMRIGIVGNRLPFFQCTMVNEQELLQRFGITVVPVNLLRILQAVRLKEAEAIEAYHRELIQLRENVDFSSMPLASMVRVLAFRDVLLELSSTLDLDGLTVENIMELTKEMGVHLVYALAAVTEKGIPAVIESDIHGVISSVLLQSATLETQPTFFMDITVRHPQNTNAFLLWHNSAPLALKDSLCTNPSIGEHWTMPGIEPGVCNWKLQDGCITIARFERGKNGYSLLGFKVNSIPGPYTRNTYVWVQSESWEALEQKIVYGPYLHHVACIYDDVTEVLQEVCKYIPSLTFDTV